MPTSVEKDILRLLAKEWEFKGPPGIMDVSDVVAAVHHAPSDTLDAITVLFTSGLVDMNTLKTSIFLTPEGFAIVRTPG